MPFYHEQIFQINLTPKTAQIVIESNRSYAADIILNTKILFLETEE